MTFGKHRFNSSASIINIVLWNIAPYLGVFFLDWAPYSVFLCYALETIVIGVFNVFKLIAVHYFGVPDEDADGPGAMGVFIIPAFITSYGLLTMIQLMLFFSFSGLTNDSRSENAENSFSDSFRMAMSDETLLLMISLFAVVNGYELINNFLLPRKYATVTLNEQFIEPFPRVIISQCIVFGGFALFNAGYTDIVLLALFTIVKIAVEVYLLKNKGLLRNWWQS